jgi:hypothetical protein
MALEQAESKIERAKHHVSYLTQIVTEFFASGGSHSVEVIGYAGTTRRAHRIVENKPLPQDFSVVIGDAAHNLRTALDLATWEVISPFNPKRPRNVQFPFVEEVKDFEDALKRREIRRANEKIVDVFRKSKPYPGGNDDLYALHLLDIEDKHKLLTPSVVVLRSDELDLHRVDPSAPRVIFKDLTMVPNNDGLLPMTWNVDANAASAEVKKDATVKASFTIAFAKGQPFGGQVTISVLNRLVRQVEDVIDMFDLALI